MADFKISLPLIHRNEGGYVNDPTDAGKETYEGVSRAFHPTWEGWVIVDKYKKALGGKIKWNTIFKDPALEKLVDDFYNTEFWIRSKAGLFRSQDIANMYIDFYVNSGGYAVEKIKQALNDLGKNIKVDETMDSTTINLINTVDPAALHEKYKAERIAFIKKAKLTQKQKEGILDRIDRSFPDLKKKVPSEPVSS
jgi:lysozyme family protein